ncbi:MULTISPECIES: putative leader peptide [Luteococcus]
MQKTVALYLVARRHVDLLRINGSMCQMS